MLQPRGDDHEGQPKYDANKLVITDDYVREVNKYRPTRKISTNKVTCVLKMV
jgi:hypothetical protein